MEPKSTNVVLIALLRVMRIFRIFWIFKNFNLLSINTVIGKLQVMSTCSVIRAQPDILGLTLGCLALSLHSFIHHYAVCFVILQYELLGLFWIISVLELLIVLVFMGHLTGCFFYMFGGSVYWRTPGALLQ